MSTFSHNTPCGLFMPSEWDIASRWVLSIMVLHLSWFSISIYHGSHFFRVTNFPDFSCSPHSFPVFLQVLFSLYSMVSYLQGFHYYWLTNFPVFFSNFQYHFFQIFPVVWVKFPNFSSLGKIPPLFPGWKILSPVFQVFSVRVGTMIFDTTHIKENLTFDLIFARY